MDRTTQPILCCIGESVAGNATQYVMERMIQSLGLDWRVLSVEVEPQNFPDALAGIRAMKFCGVRFLEPFLPRAAAEFFPEQPLIQFLSEVNAVRFTDEGWDGWNSVGEAILRCLADSNQTNFALALAGDAPSARATLVAHLQRLQIAPSESIRRQDVFRIGGWGDPDPASQQLAEILPHGTQLDAAIDVTQLVEHFQPYVDDDRNTHVCVIGDDPSLNAQVLDAMDELSLPCKLVGPISETEYPNVDTIGQAELAVRSLAANFEFWTGQDADVDLIREAYEEFVDF